jgi:hypothetical protein
MCAGIDRPAWIIFAILGFAPSHFARAAAVEHMDVLASVLEVVGVGIAAVGFVVSMMQVGGHWA